MTLKTLQSSPLREIRTPFVHKLALLDYDQPSSTKEVATPTFRTKDILTKHGQSQRALQHLILTRSNASDLKEKVSKAARPTRLKGLAYSRAQLQLATFAASLGILTGCAGVDVLNAITIDFSEIATNSLIIGTTIYAHYNLMILIEAIRSFKPRFYHGSLQERSLYLSLFLLYSMAGYGAYSGFVNPHAFHISNPALLADVADRLTFALLYSIPAAFGSFALSIPILLAFAFLEVFYGSDIETMDSFMNADKFENQHINTFQYLLDRGMASKSVCEKMLALLESPSEISFEGQDFIKKIANLLMEFIIDGNQHYRVDQAMNRKIDENSFTQACQMLLALIERYPDVENSFNDPTLRIAIKKLSKSKDPVQGELKRKLKEIEGRHFADKLAADVQFRGFHVSAMDLSPTHPIPTSKERDKTPDQKDTKPQRRIRNGASES